MILRKGRLYNNEKGRRALQPIMKKNLLFNIPSDKHIQLFHPHIQFHVDFLRLELRPCLPSFYVFIILCRYDRTVFSL